jgi:hypothetical protein
MKLVNKKSKEAVHWLPNPAAEIACGHIVESRKQWTYLGAEVTCAECARKVTSSSAGSAPNPGRSTGPAGGQSA